MPKYCGCIGYAETVETSPGVWQEQITERKYIGDVIKNSRRLTSAGVNSDVTISNTISIVADAYAYEHINSMRYVVWMNSKWKASVVEVARPRLNITLGEMYNEA